MSTTVVSGWIFSTTPCMMPTKGSLRPKSEVKVTMRVWDMHSQTIGSGKESQEHFQRMTLSSHPAPSLSVSRNDCVLRVTRHAKLGNVEAFSFHRWRHSHALHLVDAPEDNVGCTERPNGIQSCSHELAPELPRITVEQARDTLAGVAGRTLRRRHSIRRHRCRRQRYPRTQHPTTHNSRAPRSHH